MSPSRELGGSKYYYVYELRVHDGGGWEEGERSIYEPPFNKKVNAGPNNLGSQRAPATLFHASKL